MADSRTDVSFLEQPRRRWRRVALVVGAAVIVAGVVAMLWPRRERVEGHAFAIPAPDQRIIVEVLNGTSRPGLARVATRLLRRQGIDVVFLGNADSVLASTRVVVRRGQPQLATTVAKALGIGTVVDARDTLRRVDVSVILGRDFHPQGDLHP